MGVPGFAQGRSPHALAAASRATTVPRFFAAFGSSWAILPVVLVPRTLCVFSVVRGIFYLFILDCEVSVQGAGSVCAEARGEVMQG